MLEAPSKTAPTQRSNTSQGVESNDPSKVNGPSRLILIANDIVKAVLDGRHPAAMTRAMTPATLMEPLPVEWAGQRATFPARKASTSNSSRSVYRCGFGQFGQNHLAN